VRDRSNLAAVARFTITILPVNEPPVNVTIRVPLNGTRVREGALLSFAGAAFDEDGDGLNFTWYSDGKVIGYGILFTTRALGAGRHSIHLTVSDGNLSASSGNLEVVIAKKPRPAKGFLPGFEAFLVVCVLGAMVVLGRRSH